MDFQISITGPTAPFSNIPAAIERNIQSIGDLIEHSRVNGIDSAEALVEAEQAWADHAREVAQITVVPLGEKIGSWLTGSNVPGKPEVLMF